MRKINLYVIVGFIILSLIGVGFSIFSLVGVNSPTDCQRKTSRSSIPITVNIGTPDLRHVKKEIVPIMMSFDSEKINKTVEEFKDCSNKDGFDKQLLSLLEHIDAEDSDTLEKMLVLEKSDGTLLKGGGKTHMSTAKTYINRISNKVYQAEILTKIYFGDEIIYVTEFPNKNKKQKEVLLFRFKRIEDEISWFVTLTTSTHRLLKGYYSTRANERLPNDKITLYRSKSYKYKKIIYGKKSEHPVRLKFNGKATQLINIIGEDKGAEFKTLSNEYPLIPFYRHALMSYINKDFEAYKDALTPGAKVNFEGLSKQVGKDYLRRNANGLKERGRLLYFILDADPVFYLYYTNKTAKNSPMLSIELILKKSKNQYKIASSPDQFLQFIGDQDRFINPILRPIVQEENNTGEKKKGK